MHVEEIANRIQEIRQEKDISSVDMSRALGFYESYIDQIEKCKVIPTVYDLSQICHYLGTNIYDFFNQENNRSEILIQIYEELEKYDTEDLLKIYYMIKK